MGPVVSQLATTAIKGFGVQLPDSVRLTPGGVIGNRDFFLVDDRDKLFSVTRSGCFLPYAASFDHDDGLLTVARGDDVIHTGPVNTAGPVRAHFFDDRYVEGRLVTGPWNQVLSGIADRPLRLVQADQRSGGYDVTPVTLVGERSVEVLGTEESGDPLDGRRFRMLIMLTGLEPFEEETWAGRRVRLGTCRLEMGGPVPRCAGVQLHPERGTRGVNALRMIRQERGVQESQLGPGLNLGVYAEVVEPGVVQLGDTVSW